MRDVPLPQNQEPAPSAAAGPLTPFVDLASTHAPLREQLAAAFDEVVRTSGFIGGPQVERFENDWAATCGVNHAIGVANGTDALELSLIALGVGPGDDVVVPANTFVATAEAVVNVGARPVFADVDDATLLLTADHLSAALTTRTTAVIVVHLYGQIPDMDAIGAVAARAGVALIEDAAQAHGATWRDRPAGSFGHAATFSFYPGKNLGALGDAGAVVTDDADVAAVVRCLANHGRTEIPHEHAARGRNSRLDGLQAAFLNVKLPHLADANATRRKLSLAYAERLPSAVVRTEIHPDAVSSHHLEVIRVDDPERLASHLGLHRIPTGRHYGRACTRQPAFADFAPASCPIAEAAVERQLSLPLHPHLELDVVDLVCDRVAEFLSA